MGRAPCCDKANVKKGPWSPEEDAKLKSYIEHQGTGGNWIALPQKIGLKRCGKSCRLRWLNYLRPNIKHGGFSEEEDNIICSLYVSIGSRWSVIAAQLPGRTDNDIKNYWNTRLKKKLLGKQRKEQQAAARNKAIVKRENNGRSSTGTWINSSSSSLVPAEPYWPHTNQLGHSFNDQDSIRRFLVKLGGRFSDNYINDQHQPIINNNGLNFQFPNGTCTGTTTTTTLPSTLPQEQVLHIGSSSCIINSINNNNNKLQFSDDESHSNNHHQFCGEGVAVAVAGPEELVQGQGSFAAANSNDYDQQRWLEFLCGEEEMVMDDKITEEATICGQSCNWDDHDQTTTTSRSSTLIYPSHVAASNNYLLLQGHVKQEETPQQYCVFQDQYN